MPAIAPAAARTGSASSYTIIGFLPPSSSVTCLMCSAAARSTARPLGTLPVNAILGTPGWSTSAAPVAAGPVTTLRTPGGSRSSVIAASRKADRDVCSAGFSTTALPAMRGAAHLPAANLNGWLKGTIRPTTPYGSRCVIAMCGPPPGSVWPLTSPPRPAKYLSSCTQLLMSRRLPAIGRPASAVSSSASSSEAASIRRASSCRSSARRVHGSAAHSGAAMCAARTARSTSPTPAQGTVPITVSVDGSMLATVAPSAESTHSPPTNIRSVPTAVAVALMRCSSRTVAMWRSLGRRRLAGAGLTRLWSYH